MIEVISRQGFVHTVIIIHVGIQPRFFRIDVQQSCYRLIQRFSAGNIIIGQGFFLSGPAYSGSFFCRYDGALFIDRCGRIRFPDFGCAGRRRESQACGKDSQCDKPWTNTNNTTLYIGVTNNIIRRVYEHRNKLVKGFTSKYNLTKLVYYEMFDDIINAITREKYLKGKKRDFKLSLINNFNPEWKDLYEDIARYASF